MPARTFKAQAWNTVILYRPPNTKFQSHMTGKASINPTNALRMTTMSIAYPMSSNFLNIGMFFKNAIIQSKISCFKNIVEKAINITCNSLFLCTR